MHLEAQLAAQFPSLASPVRHHPGTTGAPNSPNLPSGRASAILRMLHVPAPNIGSVAPLVPKARERAPGADHRRASPLSRSRRVVHWKLKGAPSSWSDPPAPRFCGRQVVPAPQQPSSKRHLIRPLRQATRAGAILLCLEAQPCQPRNPGPAPASASNS